MAHIKLDEVKVEFPVFKGGSRSLTSGIVRAATGGRLERNQEGKVQVEALSGLSFELSDGDRLGVVGHNGAGKSTLLRVLGRIYMPTSGIAEVEGSVGSLIDISLGINPEATGRENIYLRAAFLGIPKRTMASLFEEIHAFTELGDFIDMPVRTYSTGMHLRLAFAVSTVVTPEILLMDEWLSVGDEGFRHKAEERLSSLVSETKIIVLASHSRELIEKTCNKTLWLEHGRVKMFGTMPDVVNSYFGS